ncbi:MAG TPA: ABC transporter permease [Thermoanaerobaculia bacterium]|nr:ABC transporter permease [Thermoanaerobaculia bacterium]
MADWKRLVREHLPPLDLPGRREAEVVEELALELEEAWRAAVASGAEPEEAERLALERMGDWRALAQGIRDADRPVREGLARLGLAARHPDAKAPRSRFLAELLRDLRIASRALARDLGFSLSVALVIALGVAAAALTFSVANAVLLRPLPFRQPDRLLSIQLTGTQDPQPGPLCEADYLALRELDRSFSDLAAMYARRDFQLAGGALPLRAGGAQVTAGFFRTLGVEAVLGRTFLPQEERKGAAPVAVISHRLWQGYLNGRPEAIGAPLSIDGRPVTIIGVLPPGFRLANAEASDVWILFHPERAEFRAPFYIGVFGRLKPGLGIAAARADLARIEREIKRRYPGPEDWRLGASDLKESIVGSTRAPLALLAAAVTLLLGLASISVANLLLARGLTVERELAVRAALGAGRGRLLRQRLAETGLLVSAGGALGLGLAAAALPTLARLSRGALPEVRDLSVDWRVAAFALATIALVALAVGLAPALLDARADGTLALGSGGRATGGRGHRRRQSLFVAGEVALATMLLVGAGLFMHSLVRLGQVDTGVAGDRLLAMAIALPDGSYPEGPTRNDFWRRLLVSVRAVPGVEAASCGMSLPPDLLIVTNPFTLEGKATPPNESPPLAEELLVCPGFFETLGVPLLAGRTFTAGDDAKAPPAVVINETMARKYLGDARPIGRRLQLGTPSPDGPWSTVVGVVGDVKYAGLDAPPAPTVYVPYGQEAWWSEMFLTVRTAAGIDPGAVAPMVGRIVAEIDPTLAPTPAKTLPELRSHAVAGPRFRTLLLQAFALGALAIAMAGLYGLIAQDVLRRAREIGIRRSVGAAGRDVLASVLRPGALATLAGVLVGLPASLLLARLARSLLFGIAPLDPLTYAAVPLALAAAVLIAGAGPALRALRVDPARVLRSE